MSIDNQNREGFESRRDGLPGDILATKRDESQSTRLDVDPRSTRLDSSGQNSISDTRLDSPNSRMYQRINLPSTLVPFYTIVEPLPTEGAEADLFIIQSKSTEEQFVLKLYRENIFPKAEVSAKIKKIAEKHPDHFVQMIEHEYSRELSYEIMEYLPEGSLSNFIKQNPQLNSEACLEVFNQVSFALNTLHQNNIVHRDLKPSNILVRQISPLKLSLIDFGISSVLDDETRVLTSLNATVSYASPEALFSGDISIASDFWSLGMIMVELLAGKHPFEGLSEQVIKSRMSQRSIDLSQIADPRWKNLAQGLLLRDSSKRWGKPETDQWLIGENPDIEDDSYSSSQKKPYLLDINKDLSYDTPQKLAAGLAANWDKGIEHLNRGYVSDWIKEEFKNYDLCNELSKIIENKSYDDDLRLILAISKLSPEIEPTYKQYSLTKKGLLSLAESEAGFEKTVAITWLYQKNILKIYGEITNRREYVSIHQDWNRSISRVGELMVQIQASGEVANNLFQSHKSTESVNTELLKLVLSKKSQEKLRQILRSKISPRTKAYEWVCGLGHGSLEDSPVADLYVRAMLAPMAETFIRKREEKVRKEKIDALKRVFKPFIAGDVLLPLLLLFLLSVSGNYIYQSTRRFLTNSTQSQDNSLSQNYPSWDFPRAECGDLNPQGDQLFYPVFVNRTDDSVIDYIRSNYCGDAYLMTRKDSNQKAIQVASFQSKEKADEFSQIMLRDPMINSSEIGSPSQR
jgi:serine/threonine protein kinase